MTIQTGNVTYKAYRGNKLIMVETIILFLNILNFRYMEKFSRDTEKGNENIRFKFIRELIGQNIWLNNSIVFLFLYDTNCKAEVYTL